MLDLCETGLILLLEDFNWADKNITMPCGTTLSGEILKRNCFAWGHRCELTNNKFRSPYILGVQHTPRKNVYLGEINSEFTVTLVHT